MGPFLGIFGLILVAGVPIALALGTAAAIYMLMTGNGELLFAFPQRMVSGINQFILLTVPLFILAGNLMNVGGITQRIIDFANAFVGHRRGGLSSVAVISSGLFGGVSGSATAEASALGSILIPTMKRQGFPPAYAAALVGVTALVGPIIPPSITMILFGVLAGASVGQLLLSGIIPGLLMVFFFLIYVNYKAGKLGLPVQERADWGYRLRTTVSTLPALGMPVIIVVGIKSGVFTPTESAAVAAAYAILVGTLSRQLTLAGIWRALVSSAVMTAAIMIIIAMANIVGYAFALEQIPGKVAAAIISVSDNKYVILLLLNLVLLLLGMFLEPVSILVLTMPILLELHKLVDMDLVQFGTMVVLNVVIGMATPPVGVCLFIVSAISGRPLSEVSWHAVPFLLICVFVLILIILIPGVSLFIPYAFQG